MTLNNTLLLDQTLWDLVVDNFGNIAVAASPYAIAQDAASAIKLFSGELWLDTTQGIPYFSEVLGFMPSIATMKSLFNNAALTVPGVTAANTYITGYANRVVSGQVQISTATGPTIAIGF